MCQLLPEIALSGKSGLKKQLTTGTTSWRMFSAFAVLFVGADAFHHYLTQGVSRS
jgi:hypothetical protein